MKVHAFKERTHISRLIEHLKTSPRNQALFIIGVNSALQFKDLLNLKVKDFEETRIGSVIIINNTTLTINNVIFQAIKRLLSTKNYGPEEPLFQGSVRGKSLGYKSACAFIKSWATHLGISDNVGPSSLRKTFGYYQYCYGNTDIETLQQLFKQKSVKATMSYLGITRKRPVELSEVK